MADARGERARTALVLVSHSDELARGAVALAAQMAPDVVLEAAGGRPDGGIGTDFDRVQAAIEAALAAADGVVVVADLGSAVLTVESVQEFLDDDVQPRVRLADAPFVEGAVAAAVTAQGGGGIDEVLASAQDAARSFAGAASPAAEAASGTGAPAAVDGPDGPEATAGTGVLRRSVTLRNPLGLHARPAAELARTAAGFDADLTVGGVEAASVLELMGLGATGGQELEVTASGPQAREALDAVVGAIEGGFGEV